MAHGHFPFCQPQQTETVRNRSIPFIKYHQLCCISSSRRHVHVDISFKSIAGRNTQGSSGILKFACVPALARVSYPVCCQKPRSRGPPLSVPWLAWWPQPRQYTVRGWQYMVASEQLVDTRRVPTGVTDYRYMGWPSSKWRRGLGRGLRGVMTRGAPLVMTRGAPLVIARSARRTRMAAWHADVQVSTVWQLYQFLNNTDICHLMEFTRVSEFG